MREQNGGGSRDHDGQDQDAHALGQLARERQNACKKRAEKAHADAAEHDAVLLADGDDDGEKHAEQHHGATADGPDGHEIPHQHAEHGADAPARHGRAHGAEVIPHLKIPRLRDGEAEDLIRQVIGDEEPPGKRRIGRETLAERTAHQKIARVDDQHHQRHGPEAGVGGDDGDAAVFTRRGVVQKAQQKTLKNAQVRVVRADADAEADSKITKPNGDAVAQSPQEMFFRHNSDVPLLSIIRTQGA